VGLAVAVAVAVRVIGYSAVVEDLEVPEMFRLVRGCQKLTDPSCK
jgi:hypothetical protein